MSRDDRIIQGWVDAVKGILGREPREGVEVGVWKGQFSRRALKQFPELHLLMVDPYLPYEDKLGRKPIDDILEAMKEAMSSTMFAAERRMLWTTLSAIACKYVADFSCDWIYIDANHSEESVTLDWHYWYPKVKIGGVFGGHDYNGRGDRTGTFGVKKAVDREAGKLGLKVTETYQHVWFVKKS